MALEKDKLMPTGVTSSYQKILSVEINWADQKVTGIVVGFFLDKTARDAGMTQLDTQRVYLDAPFRDEGGFISYCYTKLKEPCPVECGVEVSQEEGVEPKPIFCESNWYADAKDV